MDGELDFSDVDHLRLFPLPGAVLFPHAILPLHIFEPRYRQMTEDAIASDGLIAIVLLRPEAEWKGKNAPTYEEYACVGKILKHERLADGRFNLLLLGLRRVRLTQEVPSGALYRTSRFEIVEDLPCEDDLDVRKVELLQLFRTFLEPHGGVDPTLEEILSADLPAGPLTDILAHALPMSAAKKQELLAESQVEIRLEEIGRWLRTVTPAAPVDPPQPEASFPPRFSVN